MKPEWTESTQTNSLHVILAVHFWLYKRNFETPSLNLDSADQSNQNHSWLQTIVQLMADSFFFPADTPDLLWEFLKKPCLALTLWRCHWPNSCNEPTSSLVCCCICIFNRSEWEGGFGGEKQKKELIALAVVWDFNCKLGLKMNLRVSPPHHF